MNNNNNNNYNSNLTQNNETNTTTNDKQTLKNVTNQLSGIISSKDYQTNSNNNLISNNQNNQSISDDNNNNEYDLDYDTEANDENNTNIAGQIASSADMSTSKISEFVNNLNDSTLATLSNNNTNAQDFINELTNQSSTNNKTHRKQHSMSDESFTNNQHLNRSAPSNSSSNRRTIKKTRVIFCLNIFFK